MVALPVQQTNDDNQNPKQDPGMQGLTYFGRFKHFAIPSSIDPNNTVAVKKYISTFLNSLIQGNLSDGTKAPLSFTYNSSTSPSELRDLDFKIKNRVLSRSQQAIDTEENILYPSDLVNVLNEIYSYVNTRFFNEEKNLSSFPLNGNLSEDDLFAESRLFWTPDPNNPTNKKFGFYERALYPEVRQRLTERIQELYGLVNQIGTSASDTGSETASVIEFIRNVSVDSLVSHAKNDIIPILEKVSQSVGNEKIVLELDKWGGTAKTFRWGGPGGDTLKSYLNEYFRTFVNALAADNPNNQTLSKLRSKITHPSFFSHSTKVNELLSQLTKIDLDANTFIKAIKISNGSKRIVLNGYKDTQNLFNQPDLETVSEKEAALAKKVSTIILILLRLIEVPFSSPSIQDASDEDSPDGGSDQEVIEEKKEFTQSELKSANELLEIAQKKVREAAYQAWLKLNPQTIVESIVSNQQLQDFNTEGLWTWYQNELIGEVSRLFTSSYLTNEIKNTQYAGSLSTELVALIGPDNPFFDPDTKLFIVNDSDNTAFSILITVLIESISLPAAQNVFSKTEGLFYDFLALQNNPDEIVSKITEDSETAAQAGVPTQQKIQELLNEYNKNKPADKTISDVASNENLSLLRESNPRAFLALARTSKNFATIDTQIEGILLLQLEKQGLLSSLSASEKDQLLRSIKNDFDSFLLYSSPEKVLAALTDRTTRTQLLSEFNRQFLLNQLDSARALQAYSNLSLIASHNQVQEELEATLTDFNIENPQLLSDKIKALLVVSAYEPGSQDLQKLNQEQIEALFNISFGKELTQEELLTFTRSVEKYADQYFYEQRAEQRTSIQEELKKYEEITESFDVEKQAKLEQIATTVETIIGKPIDPKDLEKNISDYIKNRGFMGELSPVDIAFILEIEDTALANNPKLLEQLEIVSQLIIEYIETYGLALNLTRKLLKPRKMVSTGVGGELNAIKNVASAQQHGLLLEQIGPHLPPSIFAETTDRGLLEKNKSSYLDYIRSVEWQIARQELEEALRDKASQFNETYPDPWQWDSLIPPSEAINLELEIAAYRAHTLELLRQQQPDTQTGSLALGNQIGNPSYAQLARFQFDSEKKSPGNKPDSKNYFKKTKNLLNTIRKKSSDKKKKGFLQQKAERFLRNKIIKAVIAGVGKAIGFLASQIITIANLAIAAGGALVAFVGGLGLPAILIAGAGAAATGLAIHFWPQIQALGKTLLTSLQSLVSGIGEFLRNIVQGLTNFAGGGLTIIGSGVMVTAATLVAMEAIENARFTISTDSVSVAEVSEYIDISKTATPSRLENGEVADITYTIVLTAKDNYVITPIIEEVTDTFTVTGGNVSPTPQAPIDELRNRLENQVIDNNPLVLSYTIENVSGEDVLINNTFEIGFTVTSPGAPNDNIQDSFRARASVRIGNPQGSICWPTSGQITQLPFQDPDKVNDPSHNVERKSDGVRVGADAYDIAAGLGQPIYAPFDGVVEPQLEDTGPNSYFRAFGPFHVMIRSDINQTVYAFAHNSGMAVNIGDPVIKGQLIGSVGNLGNSTGPHLHFEKAFNEKLLSITDPADLSLHLEVPNDDDGNRAGLYSIVTSNCDE